MSPLWLGYSILIAKGFNRVVGFASKPCVFPFTTLNGTLANKEPRLDNQEKSIQPDFTWQVTVANWFLIGVGALIQDSVNAGGYAGGAGQFFGRLLGIVFGAAVPVAVIYLATSNRKRFRLLRALTIAGWCMLGLMFYPLLRN